MVVRSEIKIEADDASFSAFYTKFLQFQAHLDNTPEAWRRVATSANVAGDEMDKAAKAAHDHADAISDAAASTSRLQQSTGAVGRGWHDISKSTGTALKNIRGMTESLLAWTGITGIIGGAAGYLTGAGFSSIANRVTQERRQALTAGSTIGNAKAADLSYSRFLGGAGSGGAFGQRIADMQRSSEGRSALARLLPGMSQDQIANADPFDLEGQLIQAGHEYAKRVPKAQLYNTPALTGVFDRGALNILGGNQIEESEYGAARQAYAQNKAGLNPSNPRAWADFQQILETSKEKIEKTFIDRLAQLDGPIGRIIDDFSNVAVKLLNSQAFDDFIKRLNQGAEWLAEHVDTPEFRKDVDGFIDGVGQIGGLFKTLAGDLVSFARWLGIGVPSAGIGASPSVAGGGGSPSTAGGGSSPSSAGGGATSATRAASSGGRPSSGSGEAFQRTAGAAPSHVRPGWWTPERQAHAYSVLKAGGLSDAGARGLVSRWANVESRGGPAAVNSGSGAFGIGQWQGARKAPIAGDTNFDDQLNYVVHELHGRESRAFDRLSSAQTDLEGAVGASSYERAEGYNFRTGADNFTRTTLAHMGGVSTQVDANADSGASQPAARAGKSSSLPFFASPSAFSVTSMPGANPFVSAAQSGNLNGALQ